MLNLFYDENLDCVLCSCTSPIFGKIFNWDMSQNALSQSDYRNLKSTISPEQIDEISRDFAFLSFCLLLFFLVSYCFREWSKIDLYVFELIIKVYVISSLNKNLVKHLENKKRYDTETLLIDRVLSKKYFYEKIMQKMCTKTWFQIPF